MRTRTIPTNPQTPSQQNARNDLAANSAGWKLLTPEQRTDWNNAAAGITLYDRTGRPYQPTGQQYYVSINRNAYVYIGFNNTVQDVPTGLAPSVPLSLTAAAARVAGTFTVAYTSTPLAANTKLVIEATAQVSPGVNFVGRSAYRQILVTAAAAASPANIAAAYVAKFGALQEGKKIFVRASTISNEGVRTSPVQTSLIVAA